jgi:hypothetical protein
MENETKPLTPEEIILVLEQRITDLEWQIFELNQDVLGKDYEIRELESKLRYCEDNHPTI